MNLDELLKYFQMAAYAAAFFGIIFTAITYHINNKVKRGEWLKSLFEKFYEENKFSDVRKNIEYNSLKSFLKIDDKGMAANKENEEKFVNYLNFFEFISMLQFKKYIKPDEVKDMFDYYIDKLKNDTFIVQYVNQLGFENLEKLLSK
jgi:hypothetical protein